MQPVTYVAVDLDALSHNLRTVRTRLAENVRLMAVVKANAYGHGLQLAAGAFTEAGADWLGVSTVAEGVRLREAGLELPVLVFLPALADELEALIEHQLTGTIVASNEIQAYVEATEKVGRDAQVHIYVDTGLGRLGSDDPLAEILARAEVHPRLNVSAIYTHFGPGASGTMLGGIDDLKPGASARAFATLAAQTARETSTAGIDLHCAASALFLQASEAHLDMVRIGTLLYGQKPSEAPQGTMKLRKTFELRSHIVAIQTLPSGSPVGYGGEFITRRDSRIATVPVGLADGLGLAPTSLMRNLRYVAGEYMRRRRANRGRTDRAMSAMIADQAVPIVGRISMDQCCLDVTDIAAQVGAEVALPTRRVSTNPAIPRLAASIKQGNDEN
jgi:alanine racemase